jgi:metal-dependent amidase/aminoacylase/carboxypeptidase family protein
LGAQIVVAIQGIVARRVDPLDSAVISLCQFHAGTANNVIPNTAVISGTVRTLRPETRDEMERLITPDRDEHGRDVRRRGHGGVSARLPAHGEPRGRDRARGAGGGEGDGRADKVIRKRPPAMGAEDFSYMLIERPGCFLKLGQAAAEKGGVPVHNTQYDFNDDALPIGASFFAAIVEQELARG